MTASPDTRVLDLLARYGSAEASVADLLCDRHPADATAYTVVAPDLTSRRLTYGELAASSSRFAAALADLGVGPGDRVATLMGKCPEQLIAVLGIWRLGAVHVPLFTAFAPPAVAARLSGSGATVIVCDEPQRAKLAVDSTARIVVVGPRQVPTDLVFDDLLRAHPPAQRAVAVGGGGPLIELYTSGTTGQPKAVVVPVRALAAFHVYMEYGLDVRPDDVFWNAADPGWAYGHYYGITGPLCTGTPALWLSAGFSVDATWAVLSRFQVTNFAAAPTVYRQLRSAATSPPIGLRLRCASAAGEPLTPEINEWAPGSLGVPVHDHYGQTETGMLVNNHQHPELRRPPRPGSMGQPMPGWTLGVLDPARADQAPAGTVGRIAVDVTTSPLAWFTGYKGDATRSAEKFTPDGRWYLTGDSGTVDAEDGYRFLSRDDDVIIMAGYRIGPFDVESVLVSHPAVGEAAVIGAPDPLRGEVLEAYVALRDSTPPSDGLAEQLQQLVKQRLAAHAYPRVVHFVEALPRTPSGKIQRFLLREQRRAELQQVP